MAVTVGWVVLAFAPGRIHKFEGPTVELEALELTHKIWEHSSLG